MENTEILQKPVNSIVQEIKSESATLDLGEKYQFANNWDVWYHHSLNDWTVSGYRKIFSILNIKTFWDFHNNIDCIGGTRSKNADLGLKVARTAYLKIIFMTYARTAPPHHCLKKKKKKYIPHHQIRKQK